MKLKLKNFRCYLDREFDFGHDGLLLLSGQSGSGKTSILSAINFVLYGSGTKVTTFGKTSCSVQFEMDGLTITRTKRPNRLVVSEMEGIEYEDDAGQSIINEKFGTSFDVTSYVQQNTLNSFIMMSPTEKLEFLEKFAFHGIDLSQIKARCQAMIKKRNEALIVSTSQLEMASQHFKSLTKPEKVVFPLKSKDREKSMKNEIIRHRNNKILLKNAEKKLANLQKEYNDLKIMEVKVDTKKTTITSLTEQIEELVFEQNTTHYEPERLAQYEEELTLLLTSRELLIQQERYEQDQKRMEEMQKNELLEKQKEIQRINDQLWKEYSVSDVATTISEYQELLKDTEKLMRLKQTKEKLIINEAKTDENKKNLEANRDKLNQMKEKLSKMLLQQELFTCPSCQTTLRLQDSSLCVYDEEKSVSDDEVEVDTLKQQIQDLTRIITRLEYIIPEEQSRIQRYHELEKEIDTIQSQYEGDLPEKEETEENIEVMKEYKRSQLELEKQKKNLEQGTKFSSSLNVFKEQLISQREKIKALEAKLNNKVSLKIDEEELRHMIQVQRQNKIKIESYQKKIKTLKAELKITTETLESIISDHKTEYTEIHDIVDIEVEIQKITAEIEDLKKKGEQYELNLAKIDKYKKYVEEMNRFKEWRDKVNMFTEEETKNRQKYAAATLLKEKILQAESMAILNVVNSINVHAQEYLDLFFPVDPIVVRLMPFKQTKKTTKPQINLEIDYKGMEADVGMLSGGELSRVAVAYTLALAEIFNTPLILLDECTASLDQELTSVVMEGIRKNFGHKLVIIIAHQVVSGGFDRQICL